MNMLLVYPQFPDTFWSYKHALKFIRKKAALPPLGLLTIASLAPQEWKKRLVDMNVTELTNEDIAWADTVFISAMAVQRKSVNEIIIRCKETNKIVVAGGPLFTFEHGDFPKVDHFVLNEAELTFPLFISDWESGAPKRTYASKEFPSLRQTPIPMWKLLNMHKYVSMSIQYSRGCPHSCDFCNVTALFGHMPRVKSSSQIISELDALESAGWKGRVFFVDDNFIGNKKAIKTELLPALIEWRNRARANKMSFYTETTISLADDEQLMDMMVQAGFNMVFVGIETPVEESLVECKKLHNIGRELIEDVWKLIRHGLQVQAGFIVGFDSDEQSIFQRQIEFIQKSGIVVAMVGILQAPPGTKLFDRLKKEGRLKSQSSGDNTDGDTNIMPKMDLKTLQAGYRRIIDHIYAPKHYYARVQQFLKAYKATKGGHIRIDLQHLLAVPRSIVRLGIFGKERYYYWKLLAWTLAHRPRLLSEAVVFAIYGYHYRKTAEQNHKTNQ